MEMKVALVRMMYFVGCHQSIYMSQTYVLFTLYDGLKICLYRRGHLEVFELIRKRKLFPALLANLLTLLKLGVMV